MIDGLGKEAGRTHCWGNKLEKANQSINIINSSLNSNESDNTYRNNNISNELPSLEVAAGDGLHRAGFLLEICQMPWRKNMC